MKGRGPTDAFFFFRQLSEKAVAHDKDITMTFVDLEKAFDSVKQEQIMGSFRIICNKRTVITNCRNEIWTDVHGWTKCKKNNVYRVHCLSLYFIVRTAALSRYVHHYCGKYKILFIVYNRTIEKSNLFISLHDPGILWFRIGCCD